MSHTVKSRIALGTAQIGLPYGINNTTGQPDQAEAFKILDKARQERIDLLDSAEAYGNSLQVIGQFLKTEKSSPFKIVSKFIGDGQPLAKRVDESLALLGVNSLYGYMFHRFNDYNGGSYRNELLEIKKAGKIRHLGASVYALTELKEVISDEEISIIQVPFSPLDCSAEKIELLHQAKEANKEIHVRSVFLQGLLFKTVDQLTGNLKEFAPALTGFAGLLRKYGISAHQACLGFALSHSFVDYVTIGVETCQQLESNIKAVVDSLPKPLIAEIKALPAVHKDLLNPSNWKP